jgi:hypothetical protein
VRGGSGGRHENRLRTTGGARRRACLSHQLPALIRPRCRHIPRDALGLEREQGGTYALADEARGRPRPSAPAWRAWLRLGAPELSKDLRGSRSSMVLPLPQNLASAPAQTEDSSLTPAIPKAAPGIIESAVCIAALGNTAPRWPTINSTVDPTERASVRIFAPPCLVVEVSRLA